MSEIFSIMGSEAHWMFALCGLVLASGFFSSCETALFYLSRDDLRAFRVGRPRERMAAELLSDPDRLLSAILFLNLTANMTYFAVSLIVAQKIAEAGQWAGVVVFGIVSLFAIILLGEVLPKSLAALFRRRWARIVSWPLAFLVRALDLIVPRLARFSRVIRRTFWPHIKQEPYLNADDLERAVEEASKLSPEIIRQERQLLHNILDLSEITVEEVMRPRGTYFSATSPLSLKAFHREVPPGDYVAIYAQQDDEIQKAVHLASFTQFPTKTLDAASEAVPYVPWCADLAYTLQLLRDQDSGMAAVVNEYGETIGIVLAEDILDRVLLAEPSRVRRLLEREPVLEVSPGVYHVEGITTLRFLCKRLGMEYDPDEEDFVTVVGMMHEELEHLPAVGDFCQWRGYTVKVIELIGRGRVRVMVTRPSQNEAKPTSTSK
jgi:CBS domain containing-hemolysin-like protein